MSHHYMRNHYGDNCYFGDNAWKRMQRYHDSHGDTMIFNYNTGGSCWNTSCYTGGLCAGKTFWSGLGAGFGLGLANAVGGFFGGLFNMPLWGSGMFGGGWFGMPMFMNYGTVPNYVSAFTPTFSAVNTGSKPNSSNVNNNNLSNNNGSSTVNASGNGNGSGNGSKPATVSAADLDVNDLRARAEEINDESSYDDIDRLISDINTKITDENITPEEKQELQTKLDELEPQKATALVNEYIADEPRQLDKTDMKYLINNYEKLDETQQTSLKIKLIKELEDLKNDTDANSYYVSNDPVQMHKLFLLGKLIGQNIKLNVEYNGQCDDKTIEGKFTRIDDSGDFIEYDIDCSNSGKVGAVWTFQQISQEECKPTKAVKNGTELTINDVTYTWDNTKKCWVNNTGTPSINYDKLPQ